MLHRHCFKGIEPCSCLAGQVGHYRYSSYWGSAARSSSSSRPSASAPGSDLRMMDWPTIASRMGNPSRSPLLLEQQLFFGRNLGQKPGEQRAIDAYPLSTMLSLLFAPFVENQVPFALRTSLDLEKRVGSTLQPLPIDKGVR